MDGLTFIAELIKALAWPMTILVIILILRRPLTQLVPLIERLRYGDLELDFGRRVQELALEAQRELPAITTQGPVQSHLPDYTKRLAELSPRAAILESWLLVEEAALDAVRRRGLGLSSQELRSPMLLGQALQQAGILDDAKQHIFYRLRNLRNAATHAADFDFEPQSALEYADAANRLVNFIRQA